MPRIKVLSNFVRRRLNLKAKEYSAVDFKIIPKEYYERRDWKWAHHIRIIYRPKEKKHFKVIDFDNDYFEETKEHEFYTLTGALNYIMGWFPQEQYVYYYSRFREPDERFINIRHLYGFTWDEALSWQIILARAMGHLNGRRLIGFRLLPESTSKKCSVWKCKEKAVVQLVFDYRDRKYGVYYCREHFKQTIEEMWKNLLRKINLIHAQTLELIEKEEEQEQ